MTVAGFLLGTVSGSGVATTVMLGSVAWPLLRRAGYRPETAGAILSAAGIGALLSPPTLGAAAFLIAEFLQISYLQVLVMATIPTLLYYLSIFLMIEADSRRLGTRGQVPDVAPASALSRRYGYHFTSLVAIAVFMVAGLSAFRAVFWATVLAVALSFLRRESALTPRRLLGALEGGARGVLGVCATTATAGIIVGVVTLTGLGLKISGHHRSARRRPSLPDGRLLGAGRVDARSGGSGHGLVHHRRRHGGAGARTGGRPGRRRRTCSSSTTRCCRRSARRRRCHRLPRPRSPAAIPLRTMMLTWKYTLPAFLVPFVFTLTPDGLGILLQGSPGDVVLVTLTAAAGVAAFAAAFGGWILGPASLPERALAGVAGALLCYADRRADVAGVVLLSLVVFLHIGWRPRKMGLIDAVESTWHQ